MPTVRRFSCLLLLVIVITVPVARGALAPGPDGFGYSVTSSVAFMFTNITATGTKVLNFNDDTAITVNLGFSFNFYGSNYTAVSFNPNGLLTFGGASEEFSNVNLVTTPLSNDLPAIAVLWEKKIPGSGKGNSNPDGFYQLLAKDNCDPNPKIYIRDSASSFIAGPFANGDQIKLTQSPGGKPRQRPGPGVLEAHIHLRGDGLLYATDADGNVSPAIFCRVPPPPK